MIKIDLKEAMYEARLNQRQLSKVTGISPTSINLLFNGKTRMIHVDNLEKICKALKCQPGDIIKEVKDNGS